MTLTMAKQSYGVQVGNETYSLVVTDEDWEKRKLERERQKRLSEETNRRRKALEEKKKVAEEREARKRALQLSKRKQRQTEATEKYQRAHIAVKNKSKSRGFSDKKSPPLDDILLQLRSGSSEINYASQLNEIETPTQPAQENPIKIEGTMREKQQRILQEHKTYTTKEFFNEIGNQQSPQSYLKNKILSETLDSSRHYDNAYRHSYRPMLSNVDLMSGHTYHPVGPPPGARDYSYLPETMAKLFVKHDEEKQSENHFSQRSKDVNQLQLEDADDVIQSPIVPPKIYDNSPHYERSNFTTSSPKHDMARNTSLEKPPEYQDEQDSLHGSSSSGTSPILSTMTSFHKKYADEEDFKQYQERDKIDNELSVHSQSRNIQPSSYSQSGNTQTSVYSQPVQPTPNYQSVATSSHTDPVKLATSYLSHHHPIAHPPTYTSSQFTSPHLPSSSYYVKSFRPFSAADSNTGKTELPSKPRPMSAVVQQTSSSQFHENLINTPLSSTIQPPSSVTWVSNSSTKTAATPISVLYGDAWSKPSDSRPKTSSALNTSPPASTSTTTSYVVDDKKPSVTSLPRKGNSSRKSSREGAVPDDSEEQQSPNSHHSPDMKFKGILRKVSKYDSPHYHTAAVAARQKWVEHMNATSHKKKHVPTQSAKLHDTQVRDSLEVNRNERPKSVRWHQIHYDDGTSATLSDPAAAFRKAPPAHPTTMHVVNQPVRSVAERTLRNRPVSAKQRGKVPDVVDRLMKKSYKGGKGRKLKVSNKSQNGLSPHPPQQLRVVTSQSSIQSSSSSTVAGGSRNGQDSSSVSSDESSNKPVSYRIAWDADERNNVTMDNLKSCGSPSPVSSSLITEGTSDNQTMSNNIPQATAVSGTNSSQPDLGSPINLSKTPTDQEINWLWDKVRSCIAQRPVSRGAPISKTLSETGLNRNGDRRPPHRPSTSTPTQQRTSVISIDGGMFADNVVQSRSRRLVRPSSAVMATAKQRLNAYNASIKRQALLQHRRNKQFAPNRMKNDFITGPRRFPTPRVSYFDSFPTPSSRSMGQVDESTTAFLLAETLAEQNMTEEEIMKAMDSLQRKTMAAQSKKDEVNPNALSLEEHRLLKSLERLNTRLHEVESAVAANPNIHFFDPPMSASGYHDNRSRADTSQRRASARY